MVHIRDESARFSQEDFLKLLLGSLGGGGAKYGLCNVLSIFRDIDKLKGLKLSLSLSAMKMIVLSTIVLYICVFPFVHSMMFLRVAKFTGTA